MKAKRRSAECPFTRTIAGRSGRSGAARAARHPISIHNNPLSRLAAGWTRSLGLTLACHHTHNKEQRKCQRPDGDDVL